VDAYPDFESPTSLKASAFPASSCNSYPPFRNTALVEPQQTKDNVFPDVNLRPAVIFLARPATTIQDAPAFRVPRFPASAQLLRRSDGNMDVRHCRSSFSQGDCH
jgi:hypothetical protein